MGSHWSLQREAAPDVASRLVSVACHLFGVTRADLNSDSRQAEIVAARWALAKVLVEQVGWTYERVGELLAKEHTTAMRGHCKANLRYRSDPVFHEAIERMQQEISR